MKTECKIWQRLINARWNSDILQSLLKEAKELKCSGAILLAIETELKIELKIIMLRLYVSKFVFVPLEIWICIINMSNHMEYLKPGQLFTQEYERFRMDLDDGCSSLDCCYTLRTNQVCYFWGIDQFYMIIDFDNYYKTITCVELESWAMESESEDIFYEYEVGPVIKIFTIKEFFCQENIIHNTDYKSSESRGRLENPAFW